MAQVGGAVSNPFASERTVRERRRAENLATRRRVESLKQQYETALLEARHRFANSFQLLAALIHMRLRRTEAPEARDSLSWVAGQVVTLALVHKQLGSAGNETALGFFLAEQAALWR